MGPETKRNIRVALVGSGGINLAHVRALRRIEGVTLVGFSGHSAEGRQRFAAATELPSFETFDRMLDETRPEAVVIAVPPHAHTYEERCAERGIHMLIEKPLSNDYATARRIAAALERTQVIAAVGYHMRYWDATEWFRERLANRQIVRVVGGWMDSTPPPSWWQRQELSGGQQVEQTTHIFDLARLLVGEPKTVQATASRVVRDSHPQCNVDGAAQAEVVFENGATGKILSTHLLPERFWVGLKVFCSDGAVLTLSERTNDAPRTLTVESVAAGAYERFVDESEATLKQDQAFIHAVRTGDVGGIRSPYRDAMKTHRFATAAAESAANNGPVLSAQEI